MYKKLQCKGESVVNRYLLFNLFDLIPQKASSSFHIYLRIISQISIISIVPEIVELYSSLHFNFFSSAWQCVYNIV